MRFSHDRSVSQSIREYGRGVAGGLIFSLPLLYTMEVWESGITLHPWRMMIYGAATFLLLLLYNRFAGLRRDASWLEVGIDSVEELGIGLVISAGVLALLGRFSEEIGWPEMIGMTVMEAMTVAIGVSVGTAQLGTAEADDPEGMVGDGRGGGHDYLGQTSLALCGAVLFAANVAPTDEVSIIARELGKWGLILLMPLSLCAGAGVLYFAEFKGTDRYVGEYRRSMMIRNVITAYAVALVASAGVMFFFGRFDRQPFSICLAQTVVLAVPGILGASAGRLLVQPNTNS